MHVGCVYCHSCGMFVLAGRHGFRKSRLLLRSLLRQRRTKETESIKVCLQSHAASLMATDVMTLNELTSVCLCGFFSARSVKSSGIGRLLVTILEATELKAGKPNGERRQSDDRDGHSL